jgi:3-hydroxyacyl-CoA dehydrogenase
VIRIGELGEGLRRPERFCGLHFCYPAQTRRLVEVVRGPFTSDATMATACEWVRSCGKIPLPVGDAPGFVINRLLCPMFNEVGHLLTQGCSPSSIEAAAREFGFVRGPLEFMDAIGLDTLYAAGAYLIPRLTTPTEPSLLLHAMNKVGWKGRKSGRGFYAYATPTSAPEANPELAPLVAQYSKGSRKQLVADEINKRLLMVMVNQAVDVLAEKVVADESEIDLAVLHGIGFPDYRGGLLFWTRHYGLKKLVEQMQQWCSDSASPRRYRLSPNLCQLVAAG